MPLNKKYNVWLFAGALLVCFVVSAVVRYQQLETWEKTPAAYFVGERPMMTTLDAPYWLRWAREYNNGTYGQKGGLRGYPESTETFQKMSVKEFPIPLKYADPTPTSSSSTALGIRYRDVPLLSILIAHLAPFFNHNYYLTGTLLIPTLASLFILPLGIFFFQIGVPASGLLGGLIGTFAGGYYMRSSIGRIDTDMLNLFFPLLAALMILLVSRAKTERYVFLFSIGAGLCLFLFQWWYGKPGFTLAYFAVLIFSQFIQRIRFRTILLSALLFVLCAHPGTFMSGTSNINNFLKGYFSIEGTREVVIDNRTTPASFPNTMTTISEVDQVQMDEVLRRVLSNTLFAWVGFIAFFGLAVLRWRVLLPLVPMLALGLLSFQSSNRFIMYLAPFTGIGLGLLFHLVIEGVFYFFATENMYNNFKGESIKGKGSLWALFYSVVAGTHIESTTKDTDNKEKSKREKGENERLKGKGSLSKSCWIYWLGWARQGTLYLGVGVFFLWISSRTAISFVPGPSIHTGLYATFF